MPAASSRSALRSSFTKTGHHLRRHLHRFALHEPPALRPPSANGASGWSVNGSGALPQTTATLGIRPEDITLAETEVPDAAFTGTVRVDAVELVGAESYVHGSFTDGTTIVFRVLAVRSLASARTCGLPPRRRTSICSMRRGSGFRVLRRTRRHPPLGGCSNYQTSSTCGLPLEVFSTVRPDVSILQWIRCRKAEAFEGHHIHGIVEMQGQPVAFRVAA